MFHVEQSQILPRNTYGAADLPRPIYICKVNKSKCKINKSKCKGPGLAALGPRPALHPWRWRRAEARGPVTPGGGGGRRPGALE
jgi:hypothetical protein